jgi:hypothetical protein
MGSDFTDMPYGQQGRYWSVTRELGSPGALFPSPYVSSSTSSSKSSPVLSIWFLEFLSLRCDLLNPAGRFFEAIFGT